MIQLFKLLKERGREKREERREKREERREKREENRHRTGSRCC